MNVPSPKQQHFKDDEDHDHHAHATSSTVQVADNTVEDSASQLKKLDMTNDEVPHKPVTKIDETQKSLHNEAEETKEKLTDKAQQLSGNCIQGGSTKAEKGSQDGDKFGTSTRVEKVEEVNEGTPVAATHVREDSVKLKES